jgi:hypothetical protein
MSHDRHTESTLNQDCIFDSTGLPKTRTHARERYLEAMEQFPVSMYPAPVVHYHDGIRVVRDDLIVGTKARGAEALVIARPNSERFVYCQPRTGLAGVSLLDVANRMNRKVTLFMPSSKRISHHQACCIERGADPVFRRIAAMPNLNKYAREWAEENGHTFLPLGLKHPTATGAIIRAAHTILEPEFVFVAMSTGVLCRALQIAWPNARFYGVAVARNIQEGERGDCHIISHPQPFQTPAKVLPPFPSVATYDAKVWQYAVDFRKTHPGTDVLVWNVGADPELEDETIYDRVDSYREWNKKPTLLDM